MFFYFSKQTHEFMSKIAIDKQKICKLNIYFLFLNRYYILKITILCKNKEKEFRRIEQNLHDFYLSIITIFVTKFQFYFESKKICNNFFFQLNNN